MLLSIFSFFNAGENQGVKAAGRYIEAKKQQELRGKKAQRKVCLQRQVCDIWEQASSGTQGKDSKTGRAPTFPAAKESLWVFRAHLKDTPAQIAWYSIYSLQKNERLTQCCKDVNLGS